MHDAVLLAIIVVLIFYLWRSRTESLENLNELLVKDLAYAQAYYPTNEGIVYRPKYNIHTSDTFFWYWVHKMQKIQ